MSIKILTNTIKNFTHIVHVADIHVRLTKRHDEYKAVFEKLYEEVKKTPSTSLICVLGDVVHSKLDLSPECVQEVKDFLYSLADIRPTILVPGNHDANLSNKSRLDSLSPIVDAIRHENLFYLKASGLYGIGNVLINNYSILDDADKYIRGCDIPSVYRNQYKYCIAMFHGPVNNALTDVGYKVTSTSHPIDMFDGHDIALLGDIHMKQDLQFYDDSCSKPYVHYCGSLIQQNHGETLENHGFSLWELKSRQYQYVEIPNDYGYFTVKINKGVLETDLVNIPKKARLRIQCFETIPTEVKSVLAKIRLITEVIEVSYVRLDAPTSTVIKPSIAGGNISLNELSNPEYQNRLITDFLKNKLEIDDQSLIDAVLKINEETNLKISKEDFSRNIRWKPKRFEWENMFSYGEGNVIDFTKLHDVVGLFAPNTSGKSTLLSALCFCLFDKCEREFKAANILNVQKMNFKCKFNFEINGTDFFVERTATCDKKGIAKVDVEFWKMENGTKVDLNGEGRRDTNELIREYVGSYDDFELTSLSVQNIKNAASFIDTGHTERKDLLAQFMGLTVFDKLYVDSYEKLKELTGERKQYQNDDFTENLVKITNILMQSESAFNFENSQVAELTLEQSKKQQELVDTTGKLVKIEGDIPPLATSEGKKNIIVKSITQTEKDIQSHRTSLTTLESDLNLMEAEMVKLSEMNIQESYKSYQQLCKQKDDIRNKMDKKKIEVSHKLDKINKVKGYEFNPDCEFCVKNSNALVQDAACAHQELKDDKIVADEMVKQLNEIHEKIQSLSWSEKLNDDYNKLMEKRNKKKDLKMDLTNKIIQLEPSLATNKQKLVELEELITLYKQNEESIKNNIEINASVATLKQEIKNIESSIKAKNKVILDLNGKISVYKNQIEDIKLKIQNAKKVESEYKAYESYVKSVSRDGIQYEIITNTIPQIEKEINSILNQIVEFTAKLEIDGKNVVPYIVYEDKKWIMSLTSGFEKFVLSMAIRVALINISNLPRPNFLVLDEGFGVIDPQNLPSMQTLFSFLKSNFDFIIIVSHLDALRDMVDSHLEIKKENGFSKVNFE